MKWTRSEKADRNFRDARTGGNPRGGGGLGGLGGLGGGRGGAAAGAGGLGIIGLILALLFGGNILGGAGGTAPGSALDSVGQTQTSQNQGALDEDGQWFNFLLVDVQDFWIEQFAASDIRYETATLTLFDTPIRTGCGTAQASIGPHYCPLDKGIYLETGFFDDILDARFGASGDFAQAYVVAHEFGHHVQGELGISAWVRQEQQANPRLQNEYSVRLELQADCLAGVWARSAEERGLLERGDIAEALGAAAAVGDDRIQQSAGQRVNPEAWTHGSAEQRQDWFERGFDTGDTEACDTFQ